MQAVSSRCPVGHQPPHGPAAYPSHGWHSLAGSSGELWQDVHGPRSRNSSGMGCKVVRDSPAPNIPDDIEDSLEQASQSLLADSDTTAAFHLGEISKCLTFLSAGVATRVERTATAYPCLPVLF